MPTQALGIALEDSHIALVRLQGHAKSYDITLALRERLPAADDAAQQAALRLESVKRLVDTHGLRGDTVVVSLPAHRGALRNLALPFRDQRRIRQTLGFALDEHVPFEPEELVVDFRRLPVQAAPQQAQVLAAAMPKQDVAGSLSLLSDAGLEPAVFDLDVFSLADAAVLGSGALPANTAVLDVGGERALLTLMQDGVPVFARSLAQGPAADEGSLPDAERLVRPLRHTLYACEDSLQQAYEPDLLLLAGGRREALPELAAALAESTGIPSRVWQHQAAAYQPAGSAGEAGRPHPHAVALGSALRGLHRRFRGFNLRRAEFAPHSNLRELRGRLVVLGVLAGAVVALGLGNLYVQNQFKAQRLARLQNGIAEVFREIAPSARMVQPLAQAQERMRELQRRLRAFGGLTGTQLSTLQILREFSARVPASIKVEVDNLTINDDAVELSASAASYDNVVSLQSALAASPLLDDVTINNTRQGANNTVQFRLSLRAPNGLKGTP
ncbi:MAG: type II secretion system protein GspL [Candidatus Tectomicrobia bacterium]|nr:type II secretion system protein GspL [Candidatus Tectomicrobia bacterium]